MFFGWDKSEKNRQRRSRTVRSVLVVEDEPLLAFDTEYALTQAGYRVVATVDDFDHAALVIERKKIDLIIADVGLRGDRSGLDVARHAHTIGLPVLLVTGACPIDAWPMAVGCLAKPYVPRDLLAAIAVVDATLRGAPSPPRPPGLHLFQQDAA
ncbi:MAG: response regulator [Sphingobium sp.]